MKKTFIIIPVYALLLAASLFGNLNTNNNLKEPSEARYEQTIVPIYAVCNYSSHTIIYGTVNFSGKVVSTSGRVIYSGDIPLYIYTYTDKYNNYYEPYFTGYTYDSEDYANVPGCPLR